MASEVRGSDNFDSYQVVNKLYDSGFFNVATSTVYTFNHNLNTSDGIAKVTAKVINAKNGYAVGDILNLENLHGFTNDVYAKKGCFTINNLNSIRVVTGNSTMFIEMNATGTTTASALLYTDVQLRVEIYG